MDKKLILGRYVLVQETDAGNFLGFGSKQINVESKSEWQCILDLCAKAKSPVSFSELAEIDGSSNNPGTLAYLMKNNFIIDNSEQANSSRYSRTYYYYQSIGLSISDAERRLANASVIILGCGGIGNHISAALAANGVGTLYLVDDDEVELSNLTRQILFDENDVGKKKVEVLAKKLRDKNSTCKVEFFDQRIADENCLDSLPKSDLIVLSADSEGIVSCVNEYCLKRKVPYINVCYMNDIAVWGPLVIPGETGCHRCGCTRLEMYTASASENALKIRHINEDFKPATYPPVNAMASALATGDIIRFLAGSNAISCRDKRIGLHDQTLKVEMQDFSRNVDCQLCCTLFS